MNNKKIKRNLISIIKNKSILAIFAIAVMVGGYIMFQSNLFIKEQDKELNEFISSTTSIPQNLGKLYNSSNCSGGTFINLNFGKNIAFFGANQPSTILSAYIDTGFTSKYEMYVQSTGKIVTGIKVGGCVDLSQYGLTANKELVVREKDFSSPTPAVGQAFNAYGCVNEAGYSTVNLKIGNNTLPYPVGNTKGFSSFKMSSNFRNNYTVLFKRGNRILYTTTRDQAGSSCVNVPSSVNDKISSIEIKDYPECGSSNSKIISRAPSGTDACLSGSIAGNVLETSEFYNKRVRWGSAQHQVQEVRYQSYIYKWGCKFPDSTRVVNCTASRITRTGIFEWGTERCVDTPTNCSLQEYNF